MDGLGGKEARDHLEIGLGEALAGDIEDRRKLAREGESAVLAHGARAHRRSRSAPYPLTQTRVGIRNGLCEPGRDRHGLNALAQLRAHTGHVLRRAQDHVLVLDPRAQPALFDEQPVGLGGDGETVGRRQPKRVVQLAQVGHLAAHQVGVACPDGGEVQHQLHRPGAAGRILAE